MTRQALLTVIAVLEVIGGVLGLIFTFGRLANGGFVQRELATAAIPLALFLLAVCAGGLLWRDHPAGYRASVAVQLAQLIKIATPQFAFAISFGGDVAILWTERTDAVGNTFRTAGVNYRGGAVAVTEFSRPAGAPQWFGVSVVSCVALAALRKGRRHAPAGDGGAEATPAPAGADAEPDWVPPVWLKAAVALFVLFVLSCAGLFAIWR